MRRTLTILLLTVAGSQTASAGHMHSLRILTAEPAPGHMKAGRSVFVDDGTCPAGQIKMVIGSPDMQTPRQKSCVPH